MDANCRTLCCDFSTTLNKCYKYFKLTVTDYKALIIPKENF